MKRSKQITYHYPVEDEPIVLSKYLMDTFLKSKYPADLISLYSFYYYTAKWQKTNQPKATDNYCMLGLKWGYDKLQRTQKELIKLGLINKVRVTNEFGRVTGWFIHVHFLWKTNVNPLKTIPKPEHLKPEHLKPRTGKQKINALSSNNINALKTNNKKRDFLDDNFPTKKFHKKWDEWKQYKKEEFKFTYKSTISENAALTELKNLSHENEFIAIQIIDQSICKGWKGLFALNNNNFNNSDGSVNLDLAPLPDKFTKQ
jgi:hypothetical protein